MAKINKQWFLDRLQERGENQSTLARHLGVDKSAMSLLLNGRRRLHAEACDEIAAFLRVPVSDVLAAAGFKVETKQRQADVDLVGSVNAQFVVSMNDTAAAVAGHSALMAGTVAVRVQTAGTDADWMDGWLLFFCAVQGDGAAACHAPVHCGVGERPAAGWHVAARVCRGHI